MQSEYYKANGIYFFTAMLPSEASTDRLFAFAPALYARLEQVAKQIEQSTEHNARLKSEELMLQQVVDWVKDCDRKDRR